MSSVSEHEPLERLDLGDLRLISLAVWRTLSAAEFGNVLLFPPERAAMTRLAKRVSWARMRVDPDEPAPGG